MKTIIGITGPNAAGKDEAAMYLAQKLNADIARISDPLKKIAQEQGMQLTRKNLVYLGLEVAQKEGEDFLAKETLKMIKGERGIIVGIRQLEQITYLKQHSTFLLLGIDADAKIRFQRARVRNTGYEADGLENFAEHERLENSGKQPQRVFECMDIAKYKIKNEASLKSFHKLLDRILKKEIILK